MSAIVKYRCDVCGTSAEERPLWSGIPTFWQGNGTDKHLCHDCSSDADKDPKVESRMRRLLQIGEETR